MRHSCHLTSSRIVINDKLWSLMSLNILSRCSGCPCSWPWKMEMKRYDQQRFDFTWCSVLASSWNDQIIESILLQVTKVVTLCLFVASVLGFIVIGLFITFNYYRRRAILRRRLTVTGILHGEVRHLCTPRISMQSVTSESARLPCFIIGTDEWQAEKDSQACCCFCLQNQIADHGLRAESLFSYGGCLPSSNSFVRQGA